MSGACALAASVIQQDHLVAGLQHQRRFGGDDGGAPPSRGVQATGHARLGVGVQGAGGLDEHEGGSLGEQGAGQGDALALTAGQRAPLLRDHAGQAPIQRGQDVPGVGDLQGGQQPVVPGQPGCGGAHVLVDGVDARALGLRGHERAHADGLGRGGAAHVEGLAKGAGEQFGGGAGYHDRGAHVAQRHVGQRPALQGHHRGVVVEAAESGGQRRGGPRIGGDDGGHAARCEAHPGGRVDDPPVLGGAVGGGQVQALGGGAGGRDDVEQSAQAPQPDHGPRVVLHRVREHHERPRQVGGVAVEGDELAGADLPGDRHAGGGPHDDGDEQARQEHLQAHEHRLGAGHFDPASAQLLGGLAVAAGEDVLTADAPQDAQSGDRIGGDGGDLGLRLALDGLAPLEGLDDQGDDPGDQGHADEHDEAEAHGDRDHEHRHDREGHGRADQRGQALEQVADVLGVGGHDRGDLTGGCLAGQTCSGDGDLAPHESGDIEVGAHPGVHPDIGLSGVSNGVDDEQEEQAQADRPQARVETVLDAGVQGRSHEGRHDRLDGVGHDGGQACDRQRSGGAAREPAQQRAGAGRWRFGQRRVGGGNEPFGGSQQGHRHDTARLSEPIWTGQGVSSTREVRSAAPEAGIAGIDGFAVVGSAHPLHPPRFGIGRLIRAIAVFGGILGGVYPVRRGEGCCRVRSQRSSGRFPIYGS